MAPAASGGSRAPYLNCERQAGLSRRILCSMQAVILRTLGTNSRQNFKASARQARRCSGVPAALAENETPAISAARAIVQANFTVWSLPSIATLTGEAAARP